MEPPRRRKLSEEIEDCQKRWFREAVCMAVHEGDPVQMGMVGSMLSTGYGCNKDLQEAAKWLYQARIRGAIMPSSYQLPKNPLPAPDVLRSLPPIPPRIQLRNIEHHSQAASGQGRTQGTTEGLSLYKSEELLLLQQEMDAKLGIHPGGRKGTGGAASSNRSKSAKAGDSDESDESDE